MNVKFSRALAVIFGIALPGLGVVRHWTDPKGDAPGFFVDLAAGAFLLFGGWKATEKERTGQRYLAGAWGVTVGLLYTSLASQIEVIWKAEFVETPIPPEWSIIITAFGLILALVGLIGGLRSTRKH